MAISVTTWVWNRSKSRHGARLVLLFLADSMRTEDGWAWPSNREIAAKANVSERAVQLAVKDLEKLGELEVQFNAGPHGCNRYRVLLTPEESAPPQDFHPAEDAPPQDLFGDESSQVNPEDPADSSPPEESAPPKNSAGTPEESAHGTVKNRKRSSSKKNVRDEPPREDVDRICHHLVDRLVANECKRPNITQAWRREARLLLDADGRAEDKIHIAIDWCQDSPFWRDKVMSIPKLREKYDQLRLQALAQAQAEREKQNGHQGGNGRGRQHQPFQNPPDDSVYEEPI